MKRSVTPGRSTTILMAVAMALGVSAAYAQTPAPTAQSAAGAPETLQEVIVTAQFRNETVQQTPLAITALGVFRLHRRAPMSWTDHGPRSAPSSESRS